MYGGGAETPKFQSTHPVRGATPDCNRVVQDALFQSTHPVRGATIGTIAYKFVTRHFNPRTP